MLNRILLLFMSLTLLAYADKNDWDSIEAEIGLTKVEDVGVYPEPLAGYVSDIAGVLSREEEEKIEKWLWKVESKTGVEIAVVVINHIKDYKGTPKTIESFATGLFNTYKIGNLPKNDGALMLVAVKDRKVRIELGVHWGHRMDSTAMSIVQNDILPSFKKQDYASGITEGTKSMMLEFAGIRIGTNWLLISLIIAVPLLILIIVSLFRNGKKGWGWVLIGVLFMVILAIIKIVIVLGRHSGSGSSSGWSSGGFGGGFGGGSSGGGGATGSW
jgi:uncharacterized protein